MKQIVRKMYMISKCKYWMLDYVHYIFCLKDKNTHLLSPQEKYNSLQSWSLSRLKRLQKHQNIYTHNYISHDILHHYIKLKCIDSLNIASTFIQKIQGKRVKIKMWKLWKWSLMTHTHTHTYFLLSCSEELAGCISTDKAMYIELQSIYCILSQNISALFVIDFNSKSLLAATITALTRSCGITIFKNSCRKSQKPLKMTAVLTALLAATIT